ncbi:hypothetical protein [Thioalkalivibrio sulfidiphilus]|uniref:hypothetical protein n=1 Tax=Thioalkalivibrio sulfidiphilus TaxID=1033854 RepID=UPI003B2CD681
MSQPACQLGMPCFLDFEASSLSGDSYPIQVAWSDARGHIECHLIRPEADWTDWDEHSEEAHGLERERVISEGVEAEEICRRMNAVLGGQTVLTDALSMDRFWLLRLFEAGNRMPSFRLADITPLLQQRLSLKGEEAQARIQALQSRAWRNVPGHAHRADHDVAYLMELWRLSGEG